MRRWLWLVSSLFILSSVCLANFSFYLIDNFESGEFYEGAKWWYFDGLKSEIAKNSAPQKQDVIADSCGAYSLRLFGKGNDWYVGGMGTNLGLDASGYGRFQIDVYGHNQYKGKILIQLFDDDNNNYAVEQDASRGYALINDDKWEAEINIQGEGFTRVSIPMTAFRDTNPGIGNDVWDPAQTNGSGGLLQLQIVAILGEKAGELDFKLDNLLLTY